MTELSEAVSLQKRYLPYFNIMAARIHRPLKVIAFNANGIWRQLYELSKQLQDLHIAVTPLRNTSQTP
jgi:hypothetical protein